MCHRTLLYHSLEYFTLQSMLDVASYDPQPKLVSVCCYIWPTGTVRGSVLLVAIVTEAQEAALSVQALVVAGDVLFTLIHVWWRQSHKQQYSYVRHKPTTPALVYVKNMDKRSLNISSNLIWESILALCIHISIQHFMVQDSLTIYMSYPGIVSPAHVLS